MKTKTNQGTYANPLKRPFPLFKSRKQNWGSAIFFGLFVFLFLQIFKPFGLYEVEGRLWMVTFGYGLITFFSIVIMQFGIVKFFPGFYDEDSWNAGREILHILVIIFLVTTGNFFYSIYLGFFPLNIEVFVLFIGFTLAIAVFPVSIQTLIRQNQLQKKYLKGSEKLNKQIHQEAKSHPRNEQVLQLQLKDEEERVVFEIHPENLLALESADNYVEVYFIEEGKLKSELIRNSLKETETQLVNHPNFYRCHRSYLINLQKLEKVKGNARGYRLHLHPDLKPIPVARRRTEEFTEILNAHSPTR